MLQDHRTAWAGMFLTGMALACQPSHATTPHCLTHQAAAGDTLIGLSRHHLLPSASWHELARVNRVANPRRIPIGTRLCLPVHLLRGQAISARVLSVMGDVQLASASQPLQAGDALNEGARIETGPQSHVSIELADGSVLQVQAQTVVALSQTQAHESTGLLRATWELVRGRVTSWVRPRAEPKPHHQVKTPQAVLAVRGTEFRVQVGDGVTRAETLEGKVAIRSAPNQTQDLQAEQGMVIDGRTPRPRPRPLPTAPGVTTDELLFERPVVKLEVDAVPGAQGYRFQVASDSRFQQLLRDVSTAEPVARIPDLPDGTYHWRARVRNAEGLEGLDATGQLRLNARPEPPIPTGPATEGKLRSSTLELAWTQHPDAIAYRLQVSQDAGFNAPWLADETLTDTRASLPLPPGQYHWRLATVQRSPQGPADTGPWGDARQVDLRAPPAALPTPLVDPDTIRFQPPMEPGQRIRLQVARDSGFTTLLLDETHTELPIQMARPQAGGRLHVRYQATDPDGFVGPTSEVQTLELPACVETGHGACLMSATGPVTTR